MVNLTGSSNTRFIVFYLLMGYSTQSAICLEINKVATNSRIPPETQQGSKSNISGIGSKTKGIQNVNTHIRRRQLRKQRSPVASFSPEKGDTQSIGDESLTSFRNYGLKPVGDGDDGDDGDSSAIAESLTSLRDYGSKPVRDEDDGYSSSIFEAPLQSSIFGESSFNDGSLPLPKNPDEGFPDQDNTYTSEEIPPPSSSIEDVSSASNNGEASPPQTDVSVSRQNIFSSRGNDRQWTTTKRNGNHEAYEYEEERESQIVFQNEESDKFSANQTLSSPLPTLAPSILPSTKAGYLRGSHPSSPFPSPIPSSSTSQTLEHSSTSFLSDGSTFAPSTASTDSLNPSLSWQPSSQPSSLPTQRI